MCSKMLCMFYQSVVASAIFFEAIGAAASGLVTKKLNKLIRRAGSVLGTAVESLEVVMERRMVQKLLILWTITQKQHPLHNLVSVSK